MIGEESGVATVQHGGGIYGFNSMLTYYPESDVSVAVISNGPYGAGRLAQDIGRTVHGTTIEIDDLPVDPALGARLGGKYRSAIGELELDVRFREGSLYIAAAGQAEIRVLRQANGEFRATFDPNVRLVFEAGDVSPVLTLHQNGEMRLERVASEAP